MVNIKLQHSIESYMKILNLLKENIGQNRLVAMSQKEMASRLSVSQTLISKKIKRLEQYGAIKKIKPGTYRLLHTDLKHTPFYNVLRILLLVHKEPELYGHYKEQCYRLNLELKEVQQAWGFINQENKYFIL